MEFAPTRIPEVVLVKPRVFGDSRGFFLEAWRLDLFGNAGVGGHFVQDNHSRSVRHALRGLHYQLERPQGKLVSVVSGTVFDVAVDLRRSSPTFGQWVGETLSDHNHHQLWIPAGFAHGFLVLSEHADFLYKCTDYYAPQAERCIRWDDADVGVGWPLDAGQVPIVSPKDAAGASLREAECYP